jgi:aspartate carbamoyltransferase catalytic subunit
VEVSAEVADCPQSLILGQVANGLAVRMAVLWLTCGPRHAGGRPAGDGLPPATRMS